ncbi:hypothetical protein ACQ1PL_07505 [Ornithobacterium rhinotracheale]
MLKNQYFNHFWIKHKVQKIICYEYWSVWIFYAAFVPAYFWFSLKNRDLLYFCKTNPSLKNGGFFGYSKSQIQRYIPQEFRAKEQIIDQDKKLTLTKFPMIAKPDVGERGKGVIRLNNQSELNDFLAQLNENQKFILQEYIDLPKEFGVFYCKYPKDEHGQILGITGKEFLTFHGNGKQTLREFIQQNERAFFRKKYLENKFSAILDKVLPKGKTILLEPIGNHNRGTRFFDASHLATQELLTQIEKVIRQIPQYSYGRLDVKAESDEALSQGNFKVIEVNGVNSEPTHIYDKNYSLLKAYREVYKTLNHQSNIARQWAEKGAKSPKIPDFLLALKAHLFS